MKSISHEKKYILYVGGFIMPNKNAAAHRVLANAKIFKDLGYKVCFLGPGLGDEKIKIKKETYHGFSCYFIRYPHTKFEWINYLFGIKHIVNLIEELGEGKMFAIICYNYSSAAQARLKLFTFNKNILLISDATEWYYSQHENNFLTIVKWIDTNLRMRVLNFISNGIITTSPFITDFYKNKITVELPTLYDSDIVNDNYAKNLINLVKDRPVKFFYAGFAINFKLAGKNKNLIKDRIDILIDIFAKVFTIKKNFILDIYGVDENSFLKAYPEYTNKVKMLRKNIFFHGRKNHEHILSKLCKSDFSIFLRGLNRVNMSGFPGKFSESITFGTPVITNKVISTQNYLHEGKNGFFISLNDKKKQVELILKVLSMERRDLNKMKSYCIQSRLFHFESFQKKVLEFFQILINKYHG